MSWLEAHVPAKEGVVGRISRFSEEQIIRIRNHHDISRENILRLARSSLLRM